MGWKGQKRKERERRMEYGKVFRDADGTKVKIKIKTKGSTPEEMRRTLCFVAKASHQFYLDVARLENFSS